MSSTEFNLPAYLARIGCEHLAGAAPTLDTLKQIQLGHACSIPFENLDVLLGMPIVLDIESVQRKLVADRRGGYCFEQGTLMEAALSAMGFEVAGLSARVRVSAGRAFTPTRTHLFCRVTIDDVPWLVDVGVGSQSATAPVRMDTSDVQDTPHDTRRIVPDDDPSTDTGIARMFHQVKHDSEWIDVCDFTGETMPMVDREVANWWTSTSPDSKFRTHLMAARAERDGTRHSLSATGYSHRRGGETLTTEPIESNGRLLTILADVFGLVMPKGTEFPRESVQQKRARLNSGMPFINLKVTGKPTPEQKAQIVREFTDTLVRVLDKNPATTHIVIDEVADENWGFDGVLTTEYRKRQSEK